VDATYMGTQWTPTGANCGMQAQREAPDLASLDFLGRMPVPLRHPFRNGLERALRRSSGSGTFPFQWCFLNGGEWYRPFDQLIAAAGQGHLPKMLITPLQEDILDGQLWSYYARGGTIPSRECHPALEICKIRDPLGVFQPFAVVPFVFLVDCRRLNGRPIPRAWEDLLNPRWSGEIVFGGWRPNESVPYAEYNSWLLLYLYHAFGLDGLASFARNVHHLQHNVRTATLAGSNSRHAAAISVLPWLHAEICPRHDTTRVVWPEDGALVMPIGYLCRDEYRSRLSPVEKYLFGGELAASLNRNCYPGVLSGQSPLIPKDARFTWMGWEFVYTHDIASESRRLGKLFFDMWQANGRLRECA
jgi:hypothetical protein